MGVDGIHPVALAGLLKYYGCDITDKDIILHFNPLWLSSEKHDLQIEKEFNFNHPKLVPQFIPNIPCYKASYSKKFSAIIHRYVVFLSWVSHLRIFYFDSMDLPTWTLEHPYENPLSIFALLSKQKPEDEKRKIENIKQQTEVPSSAIRTLSSEPGEDFQWVTLESSLQWRFFQHSVEILRKRGNRIFVLVGPFNEHLLRGKRLDIYLQMKRDIEAWLRQNNVPYYMPAVLSSGMYFDASHPSSEGYAELAKGLFENESFKLNILH
jgi:hypothetical protein